MTGRAPCPACGREVGQSWAGRCQRCKPLRGSDEARLFYVARRWQQHNARAEPASVDKVLEEISEYRAAHTDGSRAMQLDELGDVIVNALRAFLALNKQEREFLVRVMEMKTEQRTTEGKNKGAEAQRRDALAAELLTTDLRAAPGRPQGHAATAEALHEALLAEVERLITLGDARTDDETRRLARFADAVQAYEKAHFPL